MLTPESQLLPRVEGVLDGGGGGRLDTHVSQAEIGGGSSGAISLLEGPMGGLHGAGPPKILQPTARSEQPMMRQEH